MNSKIIYYLGMVFLLRITIVVGMEQPKDAFLRQRVEKIQELTPLLINAKNTFDEIVEYYHSIEVYIDQARLGAYGAAAKDNAEIVFTDIERLKSSIEVIHGNIKHCIQCCKIAHFNVQWAYSAARQYLQPSGLVMSPITCIETFNQEALQRLHTLMEIERNVTVLNKQLIIDIIPQLKQYVFYILGILAAMNDSFKNPVYTFPASMIGFSQTAQQYFVQEFDSEETIVRNAHDILWRAAHAKKYLLKLQSKEQAEHSAIVSLQELHIS